MCPLSFFLLMFRLYSKGGKAIKAENIAKIGWFTLSKCDPFK